MAKPNYQYEKRQKELSKQQKREEKRQRKLERAVTPPEDVEPGESTAMEHPPRE